MAKLSVAHAAGWARTPVQCCGSVGFVFSNWISAMCEFSEPAECGHSSRMPSNGASTQIHLISTRPLRCKSAGTRDFSKQLQRNHGQYIARSCQRRKGKVQRHHCKVLAPIVLCQRIGMQSQLATYSIDDVDPEPCAPHQSECAWRFAGCQRHVGGCMHSQRRRWPASNAALAAALATAAPAAVTLGGADESQGTGTALPAQRAAPRR